VVEPALRLIDDLWFNVEKIVGVPDDDRPKRSGLRVDMYIQKAYAF